LIGITTRVVLSKYIVNVFYKILKDN